MWDEGEALEKTKGSGKKCTTMVSSNGTGTPYGPFVDPLMHQCSEQTKIHIACPFIWLTIRLPQGVWQVHAQGRQVPLSSSIHAG